VDKQVRITDLRYKKIELKNTLTNFIRVFFNVQKLTFIGNILVNSMTFLIFMV